MYFRLTKAFNSRRCAVDSAVCSSSDNAAQSGLPSRVGDAIGVSCSNKGQVPPGFGIWRETWRLHLGREDLKRSFSRGESRPALYGSFAGRIPERQECAILRAAEEHSQVSHRLTCHVGSGTRTGAQCEPPV